MTALSAWQRTITDSAGKGLSFAEVEVFHAGGSNKPALYADRDGTASLTNPFTADAEGFARFYVEGGIYDVAVNGTLAWLFVPIGTMAEVDRETLNTEGGVNYLQIDATAVVLGWGDQMIRLDASGATLAVRALNFVEVS